MGNKHISLIFSHARAQNIIINLLQHPTAIDRWYIYYFCVTTDLLQTLQHDRRVHVYLFTVIHSLLI